MRRRSFLAGGLALAGGAWAVFETDGNEPVETVLFTVYQSKAESETLGLWARELDEVHVRVPASLWEGRELLGRDGLLVRGDLTAALDRPRTRDDYRAPETVTGVEGEGERVVLVLDGVNDLVLVESLLVASIE